MPSSPRAEAGARTGAQARRRGARRTAMVRCGFGLRTNMAPPLIRGGAARAGRKSRSASASAVRRAVCIVLGKSGTPIA
ncbi:hypothetical protein CLM73_21860 [Achromobacter spanius]|uniref:Uncharacterized protein n=1 Tax=Achromobacter spanius TaxID=217203 RepID=A0A2S0IBX8_9BURK|nr:hypothetical protein CLM73_21860 [Achromobacter spanius]